MHGPVKPVACEVIDSNEFFSQPAVTKLLRCKSSFGEISRLLSNIDESRVFDVEDHAEN